MSSIDQRGRVAQNRGPQRAGAFRNAFALLLLTLFLVLGVGAGPGFDGCSAIQTHMTNTRGTDPEVLEHRFPVRLEEWSIRRGSGGGGSTTGGDGITRKMRFFEEMTVTTLCSHRRVPPFGVDGGAPGEVGREWIERVDGTRVEHAGNDQNEIYPGDVFVMQTPSGGGFGAA